MSSNFILTIGLPGSGKSTFIKKNYPLYEIVSTDEIRKEKHYPQGTIKDVFSIANKRILNGLANNKDIIFDATNLHRKKRIALMRQIREKFKNNVFITYILFTTPIEFCKKMNSKREGFARVPDEVIENMAKSFEIPLKGEGYDNIRVINMLNKLLPFYRTRPHETFPLWPAQKTENQNQYSSITLDMIQDFDQDNPYHSKTLLGHLLSCKDYVQKVLLEEYFESHREECLAAILAALYHDIGKVLTKDYHDRKGNVTKIAHYYGHENIGTYVFLSEFCDLFPNESWSFIYLVATFINFHMRVSFT